MQSEISLTVVAFDAPCLIEERTSVCGMCTHELRTLYSQASNPSPVLWTLFACFMQQGSRTKVTLWHVRLNLRHLKGNSIRLLAHGCTPPSTSHAFFFFAGCKFCFAFCVATEGHLLAFVISRPKASFFFFFFSQCERVSSNKSKTWSSLCLLQNALCREPKRLQLQSVSYTTLSTFFPLKWFGPQTLTGWGEAISVLQTWEPEPRVHPFVMGNRLSWTVIDFLEGSWYFEGIYFDWISDKPSVVESQGKSTKKVYGS